MYLQSLKLVLLVFIVAPVGSWPFFSKVQDSTEESVSEVASTIAPRYPNPFNNSADIFLGDLEDVLGRKSSTEEPSSPSTEPTSTEELEATTEMTTTTETESTTAPTTSTTSTESSTATSTTEESNTEPSPTEGTIGSEEREEPATESTNTSPTINIFNTTVPTSTTLIGSSTPDSKVARSDPSDSSESFRNDVDAFGVAWDVSGSPGPAESLSSSDDIPVFNSSTAASEKSFITVVVVANNGSTTPLYSDEKEGDVNRNETGRGVNTQEGRSLGDEDESPAADGVTVSEPSFKVNTTQVPTEETTPDVKFSSIVKSGSNGLCVSQSSILISILLFTVTVIFC